MDLTAENVESVFFDCLFTKYELVNYKSCIDPVIARGIVHDFCLHPLRLDRHRQNVIDMLAQTPAIFHKDTGGSFLRLRMTNKGKRWGIRQNVEQLLVLGLGLEVIQYRVPRKYITITIPEAIK